MAAPINKLYYGSQGADIYYSEDFRIVLETHMEWLKKHSTTVSRHVQPNEADKFEGDLSGYLINVNIERYLHWVIMRMNGMFSNTDFHVGFTVLLLPDPNTLDEIRQLYMTSHRVG